MAQTDTITTDVKPLRIGPYSISTPVVLAPMAGVTTSAFRQICRRYGTAYYVAQMITSRALLQRTPESMRLITFETDEHPRSVQLYGVDPATVGAAVRMIGSESLADHVDLNFGCPVSKVTRKGGGAAVPWKHELFTAIVRAAVREASNFGIPLTVKMRKGIDDDHLTYLQAAKVAEAEGVAAIALHARTADQFYSGTADWDAIARLKETITTVPVLGNGDIWVAEDALAMVRHTGCDGVVVGRGCLGRPWLFGDLEAAFAGDPTRTQPTAGEVAEVMVQHARLLVESHGDQQLGCRDFRKHIPWYLKGYSAGRELRTELMQVKSVPELEMLLQRLDASEAYPGVAAEGPRGRQGAQTKVSLPDGWLDSTELSQRTLTMMRDAEESVSGG